MKKEAMMEFMENKNVATMIKVVDVTTDIFGLTCPLMSPAKKLLIGAKDLIFKEEIEKLDQKKIEKMLENEKFVHLLLQVQDACRRSKENEKARFFTKFFRTIVENGSLEKTKSDELEEFIYLFSTLSYREILVLHKIREFTLINSKNRIEENSLFLEDQNEWYKVHCFLEKNLNINANIIYMFLSRLERTGLIIKNETGHPIKKRGSMSSMANSYLSTNYFEIIYTLSDDIKKYLDDCIK